MRATKGLCQKFPVSLHWPGQRFSGLYISKATHFRKFWFCVQLCYGVDGDVFLRFTSDRAVQLFNKFERLQRDWKLITVWFYKNILLLATHFPVQQTFRHKLISNPLNPTNVNVTSRRWQQFPFPFSSFECNQLLMGRLKKRDASESDHLPPQFLSHDFYSATW